MAGKSWFAHAIRRYRDFGWVFQVADAPIATGLPHRALNHILYPPKEALAVLKALPLRVQPAIDDVHRFLHQIVAAGFRTRRRAPISWHA